MKRFEKAELEIRISISLKYEHDRILIKAFARPPPHTHNTTQKEIIRAKGFGLRIKPLMNVIAGV